MPMLLLKVKPTTLLRIKMVQKRPKSYLLPLSKDTYNWSKEDIGQKKRFLKTTLDGVKTNGYLAKKRVVYV